MNVFHSPAARRLVVYAGVMLVLAAAAWLRFGGLEDRPLHFDEGVNARILADRLEHRAYVFDPAHYHGPALTASAVPVARLRGETAWPALTKPTLRLTTAVYGLLAVFAALLFRPLLCPGAGLAAAAFIATSPLPVYYSRMFIHETPFVFFGLISLMALLAFLERPRLLYAALLGVGAGLMAATRETVVISLFAWAVASLIWLRQSHADKTPATLLRHVWEVKVPLLVFAAVLGLAMAALYYTDFMRRPSGLLDFFRTFTAYAPAPGHEKPAAYFIELLVWPKRAAGVWWTEAGVLAFALYGYARYPDGICRRACRFLVHAGLLHLAVYSAIPYKTPWLVSLGWVHLCLAAGMGAARLVTGVRGMRRYAAAAILLLVLGWQGVQSHRAAFRFASDARNPYAYVPTSPDVERMGDWLGTLSVRHPELNREPVAVIGTSYWPLPWYLRGFDRVGYWPALPEDAASKPLLLVLEQAALPRLADTHELFPRGLRHEVTVTVAIRKDVWEKETAGVPP